MCLSTGCGFCLSSLTLEQGIKNHISDSLSLEKGSYILLEFDSGIDRGVGGRGIRRAPHVLEPKTLLRMYLTIPVTSATSERTFSVLRRLKNYQRSTYDEAEPSEPPKPSTAY